MFKRSLKNENIYLFHRIYLFVNRKKKTHSHIQTTLKSNRFYFSCSTAYPIFHSNTASVHLKFASISFLSVNGCSFRCFINKTRVILRIVLTQLLYSENTEHSVIRLNFRCHFYTMFIAQILFYCGMFFLAFIFFLYLYFCMT